MTDVRHFPTGLPYREVGETRMYGRNKPLIGFLESAFTLSGREQTSVDAIIPTIQRVESILRNGLPTEDAAAANVIASAHDEVERLRARLYAADLPDWWTE